MNRLPPEACDQIVSYLPFQDATSLAQTNTYYKTVVIHNPMFRQKKNVMNIFYRTPTRSLRCMIHLGFDDLIAMCIHHPWTNVEKGLREALIVNRPALIQLFLDHGAQNLRTAIRFAAQYNHNDWVDFFLVRSTSEHGRKLLVSHAIRGYIRANNMAKVKSLCEAVDFENFNLICEFVTLASALETDQVLLYLLNHYDLWDSEHWGCCLGSSVLRGSSLRGNQKWIDFVISRAWSGWDDGLRYSASGGHLKWVRFFIGRGAFDLKSAFFEAVYRGQHEIVDFFLHEHQDIISPETCPKALQKAIEGGHSQMIYHLMIKGFKSWKHALLGAACQGHRYLFLSFLKKVSMSIDLWTQVGHQAVKGGHHDIFDFAVVQHGGCIKQKTIQVACEKGHISFVRVFRRCSPYRDQIPWNTIADIAYRFENDNICTFLREE